VDFTPSQKWTQSPNFPDGYEKAAFDSMLFSKDYWKGEAQESPHPDGHALFGSFVNYYDDQSFNTMHFEGLNGEPTIINPDTLVNGYLVPKWVVLPNTKTYYSTRLIKYWDDAADSAESQLGVDLSQFDFLAYISAGPRQGWLRGVASPGSGRYNMTEVGIYVDPRFFSNIGGHPHEFAHLLGILSHPNYPALYARYWNLMGFGGMGPGYDAACPAGFCPYSRIEKLHFAEYDTIYSDTTLTLHYDYQNPKYYLIQSRLSNDYYVIENRLREGFDLYTPNDPDFNYTVPISIDPNGNAGGLLIWRNGKDLLGANNIADPGIDVYVGAVDSLMAIMAGHPFPFDQQDPDSSGLNFNDETTPGTQNSNGTYSHLAVNNITWNSGDSSVTVNILFNYGTQIINSNTTWSGTVELDRDVAVVNGAVLSIEPGTIVKVDTVTSSENVEIRVEAGSRVEANGTETSPVIFKSALANPTSNDWGGFVFSDGGEGIFTYTDIRHTLNAITGNFASGGKLEISYSHFESTYVIVEDAGNTTFIKDSEFTDLCIIQCWNSSVTISGNRLLDKSNLKLYADASTVKNNVIVGVNGTIYGIYLLTDNSIASSTDIINNSITFYQRGIAFSGSGHSPLIKNNILYRNSSTGTLQGTVQYNNFWNNDSASYTPPDTTSIEENPRFVDATNGDFHLKANSPCIDRGDPTDSYANEPQPNGGRINMGAYGNTVEATLSFNIIAQNNLTANTAWGGYVNVMNDISTNGYALTVNPGTKVLFDNETALTITGEFMSDGDDPELGPDPIVFSGYRENDQMAGVIINAGDGEEGVTFRHTHFKRGSYGLYIASLASGENLFENLTFQDNTTGLYTSGAEFDLANSYFKNNQTGFTVHDGSIYLNQCNFDSNSVQGAYLVDAEFWIHNCNFRDNGQRGVYFDYSSDGNFYDNVVSGNGYASEFPLRGGLVFYQSSPFLYNNRVYANQAPGVLSLSSAYPIMVVDDGSNFIAVNGVGSSEIDPEILVYDISFPILDYGYNDIVDTLGGNLIYGNEDSRDITLNIRENYWGTTDTTEIANRLHRPSGFDFTPISTDWNTGGFSFNKGTGQSENILAEAFRAERDSNYTAAIALYDSLANDTSLAAETKAALERLYYLKLKTGENINTIKSYFDNLSSHPDEALATVARRIAIRCLTYNEEYQNAISQHSAWAQTTPYFCDSVYSEIDILTNEFLASGSPFGKTNGGKMGKKGAVTAQQVKAHQARLARYQEETEKLLNLLFASPTQQVSLTIPGEFALSQNYPNPFNPVTTIEYQLPFDSKVKIEIYNILGQRVKTLIDRRDPAGKYKITWDGRNDYGSRIASGLYIYRIQAVSNNKTYITARKMILIR